MNRLTASTILRLAALVVVLLGLYALITGWQSYRHPQVVVEWSTATELDTAGFNLYRGLTVDGPFVQVNDALVPSSPDPLTGGDYQFVDLGVSPGVTYFYELEEVENGGGTQRFDPIQVAAGGSLVNPILGVIMILAGALFFAATRQTGKDQPIP